ncbi:hypothetical protein IP69_04665 [Bosea sp. AAP35]|uniref:hypothetical protein n=1 Tax=Bosea sp. AAP35 TaxID=1523417 RepID=UPI0006B94908|nr:hypothetical protein [Bosea sp. AAP35]KPF71792.1 hypothetical protein IP69_04665 [Bosea sp. AAP35]
MRSTIEEATHTGADRSHFEIETIEDYELATRRIADLDACARAEADERERQALLQAVARWDRSHDDATRWRDKT